jgi:hypothetical protein
VRYELSDANSMVAGLNLSSAAAVTVEARVSQSGLAASASGDLLATSQPFDPRTRKAPINLEISKVVP